MTGERPFRSGGLLAGGLLDGVGLFFWMFLLRVGEHILFCDCLDGVELCEDPEEELLGILGGGVELLLGKDSSMS